MPYGAVAASAVQRYAITRAHRPLPQRASLGGGAWLVPVPCTHHADMCTAGAAGKSNALAPLRRVTGAEQCSAERTAAFFALLHHGNGRCAGILPLLRAEQR